MNFVKGNLLDLAEEGNFDLIFHGCNCFHTMGAGIAREIKDRYWTPFVADKNNTKYGDINKLGSYTYVGITSNIKHDHMFYVVNAYTQYTYRKRNSDQLIYDSIRKCLINIRNDFIEEPEWFDLKIGYPKIGAGLAGGDWNIISKIIDQEFNGLNHTLVIL